jgi:hypothetical protein
LDIKRGVLYHKQKRQLETVMQWGIWAMQRTNERDKSRRACMHYHRALMRKSLFGAQEYLMRRRDIRLLRQKLSKQERIEQAKRFFFAMAPLAKAREQRCMQDAVDTWTMVSDFFSLV